MRIGELAKAANVGVETVRFYERKGLIQQPLRPSDGGFRTYPRKATSRIRFIRQAQDLGFSLREIEDLLSLRADPQTDCGDVKHRAQQKRDDVDDKIAQLQRIRLPLTKLIEACPGKGGLEICSIMDSLDTPIAEPQKQPNGKDKEVLK